MLILKALLLGSIVAVHVVGAAFVFRRIFPRDSRWLAFVLPELLFVLLCNFGEHLVPLTYLRGLLPLLVAQLKTQLAPYYTYDDANSRTPSDVEKDVNPGNPAAGVFVYHPEITTLLGDPKTQAGK